MFFLKRLDLGGYKSLYAGVTLLMLAILLLGVVLLALQSKQGGVLLKQKQEERRQTEASSHVAPEASNIVAAPAVMDQTEQQAIGQRAFLSVPEGRVVAAYGWQLHPVYQDWRFHTGVDISLREGAAVKAVGSGKVLSVSEEKATGITVAVEAALYTLYYGSLATVTVQKGEQVRPGQLLGTVGSCMAEPQPHLHFAVKKQGKFVNPLELE